MIRAREYVSLSSEAAFAVSGELRVLAWNRSAECIFGLAAADVVGRRCSDVVSAELPSGEPLCGPDCHGRLCFRNRTPFSADDCLVRRPGRKAMRVSMTTLIVPSDGPADPSRTCAPVFVHGLDRAGAGSPMPQPLHIRMLGRFSVTLNERHIPVETWQRKAAVTVLKILAIRPGHLVPRDRLIEFLWPGIDERRGRDRLKVAVYSLRQLLGHAELVEYAGEAYALRAGAVLLDVAVFERLVAEGSATPGRIVRTTRWPASATRSGSIAVITSRRIPTRNGAPKSACACASFTSRQPNTCRRPTAASKAAPG
ncbi:MAG: winged helix-turn-helix domain-containing protein [Roseovarius sp.]|nr:winged helix-turn-helix domain-containing protein [Roseovarius sp.]